MQKCKTKFTLLLPVDMDGLTRGGGAQGNDIAVGPSVAQEVDLGVNGVLLIW